MGGNCDKTAVEGGSGPPISESWLGRHAPYVLLLAYLYYCTQIATEISHEWFYPFGMLPIMASALVVLMLAAFAALALRVVGQVMRKAPGTTILRNILGEPSWWRTWYPRTLRSPASVWDKLPPALKVIRTAIWLGLLLLPAGAVLVVFVIPTFGVVYERIGLQLPSMMRSYSLVVTVGAYVSPLILLAAVVQGQWHARQGLPRQVALNALFSVSGEFWRDTEARKLLRH